MNIENLTKKELKDLQEKINLKLYDIKQEEFFKDIKVDSEYTIKDFSKDGEMVYVVKVDTGMEGDTFIVKTKGHTSEENIINFVKHYIVYNYDEYDYIEGIDVVAEEYGYATYLMEINE